MQPRSAGHTNNVERLAPLGHRVSQLLYMRTCRRSRTRVSADVCIRARVCGELRKGTCVYVYVCMSTPVRAYAYVIVYIFVCARSWVDVWTGAWGHCRNPAESYPPRSPRIVIHAQSHEESGWALGIHFLATSLRDAWAGAGFSSSGRIG